MNHCKPYEEFKRDAIKLCDHTLAKQDKEIHLDAFILFEGMTAGEMQRIRLTQNLCGTPACLFGNMPEVFPDMCKYGHNQDIEEVFLIGYEASIYTKEGSNPGQAKLEMERLVGLLTPHSFLFDVKIFDEMSDREEVELRRDTIAKANSYKELAELIDEVFDERI